MKIAFDSRTVTNVVSLVLCGILAGVVVAAAAFPAVGVSGLTAKSASDSFQNLPAELKVTPPPQVSTIYTADGKPITTFFSENRVPVTLDKVAKVMQQAMVAAEDNRFYDHEGVDMQGVVRAFVANQQSGAASQGASTLTQQYVRLALTYSARSSGDKGAEKLATEDTPARKLREIRYAVALEKKLSKEQILERYLNTAYFGAQGYGIYAASMRYFSVTPDKLTLPQASLIAGLVQSPGTDDPLNHDPKRALQRRSYTLDQMVKAGNITQAQADEAKKTVPGANPLSLKESETRGSCETGNPNFGFYCSYFLSWWRQNPAFGRTPDEREQNLKDGGYQIYTAVDSRMQAAAQTAADRQSKRTSNYATGIVLVEPGTGRVKAMAVTRNYSLAKNAGGRDYPNTTNSLLYGTSTSPGFQAGSTFKLFTMVTGLKQGKPLNTKYNSPFQYTSKYIGGSCGGKYCPKNASKGMTGTHTMYSAFGESVNTYFMQLEEDVSVKAAVKTAEDMGIVLRSGEDLELKAEAQKDDRAWGSFTLGVAQVSPLDVANAYATVASRGIFCNPLPIQRALREGKTQAFANPTCKRVMTQQVADAAADAARCPVGQQAMTGAACSLKNGVTARSVSGAVGRPVAGKTGTTDKNKAAWFAGFTPNLSGAAFYTDPDNPNKRPVPNTRVPIEVFKSAMGTAVKLLPRKNFVSPNAKSTKGVSVTVPNVAGRSVAEARSRLTAAGFSVRVESGRVNSSFPDGRVARTDPGGGESTAKGSRITIFISNGNPAPATSSTPKPGTKPTRGPGIIFPPRR